MITVEHLTKCYGDCIAVDDLSFEIQDGYIYGVVGSNGAGKSTIMNIIAGYLPEYLPLFGMNKTPTEYSQAVSDFCPKWY